MVEYASPPRYPTPDYGAFGAEIADLPNVYRRAQAQDLALQDAQMQINARKAIRDQAAGGAFVGPDGQFDYAKFMQAYTGAGGDIGALPPFGRLSIEQQQFAPSQLSPLLSGGSGGGIPVDKGAELKQLREYAKNAGLSPEQTNRYVATAIAESGLDPNAVGDDASSFGVFQGHVGGVAGGANTGKGIGDDFMRETGMSLAQFRSPEGQKAFNQWVANNWGKYGNPNIFHAERTPRYQDALTSLGGGAGNQFASRETGTSTDASPRVPPVSAAAGSSIPRSDGSGGEMGQTGATVGSLVSGIVQDPQRASTVAATVARAVGVTPDARLSPEQAQRAQRIVQNYAARTGQTQRPQLQTMAAPQGGQFGAPSGQSLVYMPPLPPGARTPQEAVEVYTREITKYNPNTRSGQQAIKELEHRRDFFEKASSPMDVRPGEMKIDPRTGQMLFQAPLANVSNLALQRFLEENPNATAEQIQQFNQAGRTARSGVAMFMQKYLLEHPEASAQDVAKAAQDFHAQGTALTKFSSGPQGNAVRSFNVLVDHLGVLRNAVDALKNGDLRLFNQFSQSYAKQTGETPPTNFDAVKSIVGDELVKAIVGGAAALGDRQEIKEAIDKTSSPQQLYGVINQYRKLAVGQLHGLKKQYETATGREDFDNMLAPGTLEFFVGKGGGSASASGAPPNGATPQNSGTTSSGIKWSVQ